MINDSCMCLKYGAHPLLSISLPVLCLLFIQKTYFQFQCQADENES